MSVCPKCQSDNVEYFIAGYCMECAGEEIKNLEAENSRLKKFIKDNGLEAEYLLWFDS